MSMYVCLSVCPHAYLKNHRSKVTIKFSEHVACLWPRLDVRLVALCTSGFVDCAIFAVIIHATTQITQQGGGAAQN